MGVWDQVVGDERKVMSGKSKEGGFKYKRPGDNFTMPFRWTCRKVHLWIGVKSHK